MEKGLRSPLKGGGREGDFHGALNFAATLECPVVFFCRSALETRSLFAPLGVHTVTLSVGTIPCPYGIAYRKVLPSIHVWVMEKSLGGSEGGFHGALNFAATLECPVVFFCRSVCRAFRLLFVELFSEKSAADIT
jgi:hypothetical protein